MALGDKNGLFAKMVQSVKDLGTKVAREEAVARFIANAKLEKEVKVIAPLHELILKQQIEVKKLEKPPVGWDEEGKEVTRLRTREEHEALQKARDRLNKMEKAYEKACDTGDLSDANNFVQQSGGKDKGNKEGESS